MVIKGKCSNANGNVRKIAWNMAGILYASLTVKTIRK